MSALFWLAFLSPGAASILCGGVMMFGATQGDALARYDYSSIWYERAMKFLFVQVVLIGIGAIAGLDPSIGAQ